jgi:glycosyltransferase involved in cell wall biosynthesis
LSWIGKWLEKNPNVEFVAASGDSRVHDILNVPQAQRVTTNSVNFRDMDLADITAVMDIGLVPLDRIPFNEAKSHLKGMEYAACGIPCIATPTESYRYWVEDGVNGFLAKSEKEWTSRLDELVADKSLRTRMGEAARMKASQNTIQEHWQEWEDVYGRILGQRSHADTSNRSLLLEECKASVSAQTVPVQHLIGVDELPRRPERHPQPSRGIDGFGVASSAG